MKLKRCKCGAPIFDPKNSISCGRCSIRKNLGKAAEIAILGIQPGNHGHPVLRQLAAVALMLCLVGCDEKGDEYQRGFNRAIELAIASQPTTHTNDVWDGFSPRKDNRTIKTTGRIWISWRENGHCFMAGMLKEFGSAGDDPNFVQTSFDKGYSVSVFSQGEEMLFHDCCTTNITVGASYPGTITLNRQPVAQETNGVWVIRFK